MSNTATRRLALAVPLLLSSMGCSDSDDSPSGGGRPPLPQAKAYPIVHYDRHAASDIQDQFVVASLTLDTGLLVLDMGPHNCDIARSNVKLTDVEMNRGRSLFSEQKIEAYRGVGGVSYDDGVEPAPAAAPGEARQTPPAGLCDQPPTPDGVYFYFQLPGNHLEWPEVRFPANSIPAVAKEAVAFMRELETKYHP